MDPHTPPIGKPRIEINNMPATTISRPAPTTHFSAPHQRPNIKEGRNYMDIDEFFQKVGGETSPKRNGYSDKLSTLVSPILSTSTSSSAARGQALTIASQEEKLKILSALYRKNDLEARIRHASPHERHMYYERDEMSRPHESLKRRYEEHDRSPTQIYRRIERTDDPRYASMPPLTKIAKGSDDSDTILQRKIERKLKDPTKDSRHERTEPYIDVLGHDHVSEVLGKQSNFYQRTNSLDRLANLEGKVTSANYRPPSTVYRPRSADSLSKVTESRSRPKSYERINDEDCIPKESEPRERKTTITDSLLMKRLERDEEQKFSSDVTSPENLEKGSVSDVTGGTLNSSLDESSRHCDSSHESDSSGKSEVYDESYQIKTQAAHGLISLNNTLERASGGEAINTNGAAAKVTSSDDGGAAKVKKRGGGKPGRRRKRGYIYDPKPLVPKSKINNLPAELKDKEYWTRRQRNNEAAKRSRENRRVKELEMMTLVKELTGTNTELRTRIQELEVRNKFLEQILSRHPSGLEGSGGSNASSSDMS